MRILISGASIAGPVLAYWLTRHGFEVTVVERAPALRKAGGHAVDLFRPAMEIVERMGVLPAILDKATGTDRLTLLREGSARAVELDLGRLFRAVSDRHVEIMRDDLAEALQRASADAAEYVFGDSIAAMKEDPGGIDVTFERGPPRRFDLVLGADGLHSRVRALTFGDERGFSRPIGASLAVMTVPNYLGLTDHMIGLAGPGRMIAYYSGRHMDDARAVFLFRTPTPLGIHHRDVDGQKAALRRIYAGLSWEVPRLLDHLDDAAAFYFDAITQIRLDPWSRGRVSLCGDAGYSPGPAVGGSTSLAVVGAYVLAGELAAAGGDPARGFPAYEAAMREYVRRSRDFANNAARGLIPRSRLGVWAQASVARAFLGLPTPIARALSRLGSGAVRLHDAIEVKDYAGLPRPPARAATRASATIG